MTPNQLRLLIDLYDGRDPDYDPKDFQILKRQGLISVRGLFPYQLTKKGKEFIEMCLKIGTIS